MRFQLRFVGDKRRFRERETQDGRGGWPLIVALLMMVAAAGCGGDDDEGRGRGDHRRARNETAAGEAISVGMVSDTGGLNDDGFNEFSLNGFERAEEELGVDRPGVYVPESADDYLPNLTAAVDDGHDLVDRNRILGS